MLGKSLTIIILFLIGGGFILLQILLRRSHAYLMYFGLAIILAGITWLLPEGMRLYGVIAEVVVVVLMFYEAIQETRDRVKRLREEHQQRAEAFGEFLEALARKEKDLEGTPEVKKNTELPPI